MGGKSSKDKKPKMKDATTAQIDAKMHSDAQKAARIIKLLLLGAGESGKSTLFKQSIKLYGAGFNKEELDAYTSIVNKNIINGMHVLVTQAQTTNFGEDLKISDEEKLSDAVQYFLQLQDTDVADTKLQDPDLAPIVQYIRDLWSNKKIKRVFELRAHFQIPDSASYFFSTLDRIAKQDYSPSYDDMLRCRSRTTGIVETSLEMGGRQFRIMDVGGQRSERKKWIHCFKDVTAVIFVAAINEYDQTLFEEQNQNRVIEALDLFDKTCNSGWFESASYILFLNKQDLFREKLKTVDLSVLFSDYKKGNDPSAAEEYLQDKFKSMNRKPENTIYCHVTCATDSNNVKFTFDAVREIIINASLRSSNLIF